MPNKILLVDDDQEFRKEFKEYLGGYDLIEASDGEEAINLLKRPNEIDLVLLDVKLPGLKGTEVLRQMKKIDPDVGIIILTGYGSKDVAVEALKNHADDYIEKTFASSSIKETIDKFLDSKRGVDATDIKGKVERVKRFAERNCHKRICLKDAAEIVCLSPKYLSRVFKEHTAKGFSEYRLEIKINKTKNLLRDTAYNVNEIANNMGYENSESFIRIFKKITGQTPTEYRRLARSKKDGGKKYLLAK